ncbi:Stk1 family PASTA domain-containing Ser/Thr kinase [Treponema sp. R6D11]
MINKIIGGRYELLEEIGNGGMAIVYKGYDKLLGRNVAVKVLRKEFNNDNDFIQNFITEARAAASLSHQNLVGIYDVGNDEEEDIFYIVMEYLNGVTLKDYIKANGHLGWQESCSYILQILKGLAHAHAKGVIHRDIKPQNIMLLQNGVVKIMDFGIARAVSSKTVKIGGGDTLGSAHYLSPEQAKGRHTDEKSDIYSLGIVMYEMLTGSVPFDGDNAVSVAMMHISNKPVPPSEVNSDIPPALDGIILRAIAKDRASRYSTASEMLEDVKIALRAPDSLIPMGKKLNAPEYTQKISTDKQNSIEALLGDDDVAPAYVPVKKERASDAIITDKNVKKLNKAGLISGCIFGVLGLLFLVYAFFPGAFGGRGNVVVPDLVGKNIEVVKEAYKDNKDIEIIIDSRRSDAKIAKDSIIEQTPAASRTVRAPIEIHVVVSDGIKDLILPDLINKDERAAKQILQEMGIKFTTEKESSADVAEGLILKMTPTAGSTITSGLTVKLVVSTGKNGIDIKMPNFIGLSLDAAKRLADEKKLVVSTTYVDGSEKAGTVINQSPGYNEKIKEFSTITLVLSNGRLAPTATPTPTPSPTVRP